MLTNQRDVWIGRMQVALAGVLWSTSGLFVKAPWFDGWPLESKGILLAFWRSFFSLLLLVPLIRQPQWRWQMLPMMICFTTMNWSFLSAMVHGPAANATWLQNLSPVWVVLIGVGFLRERFQKSDVWMFVCCLSGVGLILSMELQYGSIHATLLGIASGVSFAGVILFLRALRGVDAAWLIALNHIGNLIVFGPWAIQHLDDLPAESYLALAVFGIFQMSLPYLIFARGLRTTPSPEASLLTLIEPVLVPVWVFVAWRHHATYQPLPWWTWCGGGFIFAGLLLRYVPSVLKHLKPASDRLQPSQVAHTE